MQRAATFRLSAGQRERSWGMLDQVVSPFDLEPRNRRPAPHRVCQNTEIRSTRRENSVSEAASHFQEDLMANLWSSAQLPEHFLLLWTSRYAL